MGGGTPHITPHNTQNQGGGHRTRKCVQMFTLGWGHRTRKCVQMFTLGWGHRTEFKERGGGHRTNQSRLLAGWLAGWLGGWLAGSMIIVPILAPSCKLKLARFSAKLRIQDGAQCGNILKYFFGRDEVPPLICEVPPLICRRIGE